MRVELLHQLARGGVLRDFKQRAVAQLKVERLHEVVVGYARGDDAEPPLGPKRKRRVSSLFSRRQYALLVPEEHRVVSFGNGR